MSEPPFQPATQGFCFQPSPRGRGIFRDCYACSAKYSQHCATNNVGMFHYIFELDDETNDDNYEKVVVVQELRADDIFGEDKELVDEFACGEG